MRTWRLPRGQTTAWRSPDDPTNARSCSLAAAALALAPLIASAFTITLLNYIGIGAIVALGLVLLTGIGGLTSFGQAALVGIGAYTTAWLTTAAGVSPWLGLVASLGADGRR